MAPDLPDPPTAGLLRLGYNTLAARIFDAVVLAGFGDLRPAHGNVMEHLSYQDGLRQTDLATRAGMTAQSMGELVEDLGRLGYVERRADPADGRARRVHLTPRGRRAVRASVGAVLDVEAELLSRLGPAGYGRLRRLLKQVVGASPRSI